MSPLSDLIARLIHLNQRLWPVLTLGLLLIVSYLTLTPNLPDLDVPVVRNDKFQHMLAFGAIVFPISLARPRYWLGFVLLIALWSGMIEILQGLTGRHGSVSDFVANVVGITGSVAAAHVIKAIFAPDRPRAAGRGKGRV